MNHSVKVTSKGQITLPADIRRSLQIEAGDSDTFVQNASGHYELRGRRHTLADLIGAAEPQQKAVIDGLFTGGNRLFINHIVIIEMVWVLKNRARLTRDAMVDVIEALLSAEDVVVQERGALLSSLESCAKYPGDFADHLIGEINRQNGCETTLTLDKAAAKSPNFCELKR
ncbi:MAG: AbrB/MazE/SpoVT family DNA-binding domain-containing protein [Allorhizobium sp.]